MGLYHLLFYLFLIAVILCQASPHTWPYYCPIFVQGSPSFSFNFPPVASQSSTLTTSLSLVNVCSAQFYFCSVTFSPLSSYHIPHLCLFLVFSRHSFLTSFTFLCRNVKEARRKEKYNIFNASLCQYLIASHL